MTSPQQGRHYRDKAEQLDEVRQDPHDTYLTTQQGVRVDHTDDALTAGDRGPALLEDFHAREKITHFDHERIPERVVHARGAGAHGYFQPYDAWLSDYTVARFLTDPGERTPVFVRFSTAAGSRGSADTVRDVRGFATKFYTSQGNHDLVGNNVPVFFIQDGIKFPDLVHALKPEPDNEIPQATSAHDTFWDFVSLQPEAMHAVMWLMSDRALPRSYRMMQGFGVHTFRLVDAGGGATFVKFHWTPLLGTHSLVWDEAQQAAGKDADFHRRDLWNAIEAGHYPEYELGVQLVDESREFDVDVDLLDPTKLLPEEQVPVRPVGRMVLDRNPDNFFAETEQVAFHTANLVPGIDVTDDPLLQARTFSYLDAQLARLGGPNSAQIPVNRPITEVSNNQRDGHHQMRVPRGKSSYERNSLAGGCPVVSGAGPNAFSHHQEEVAGAKVRRRSPSFRDHYDQATLFWNSMAGWEREHIVAAFRFELGKVDHQHVRDAAVEQINHVDHDLAVRVARGTGVTSPQQAVRPNHGRSSPALSQVSSRAETIATREVAVLVADGVDVGQVEQLRRGLARRGASAELLAPEDGTVRTAEGRDLGVDRAINTVASVVYDAVVVPGGADSTRALLADGCATHFVLEAYKHAKPVGAAGEGVTLLQRAGINGIRQAGGSDELVTDRGVVTATGSGQLPQDFLTEFARTLAAHRAWDRDTAGIPA